MCFTESTLAGLRAHRDVFKCKYGVAFDRKWLYDRGGNPCLNIREDILKRDIDVSDGPSRKVFNYLPQALLPFVNIVNESFDATHEREWRHPGNLTFGWTDLKFVFCPEEDFATFARVQERGTPCLFDLAWLDRV